MRETIACWIRDRSTRYPTLVCLALVMVAAPVAVHADAAAMHFYPDKGHVFEREANQRDVLSRAIPGADAHLQ